MQWIIRIVPILQKKEEEKLTFPEWQHLKWLEKKQTNEWQYFLIPQTLIRSHKQQHPIQIPSSVLLQMANVAVTPFSWTDYKSDLTLQCDELPITGSIK